jgi:peptide/nickel transport system substrate-binding protein
LRQWRRLILVALVVWSAAACAPAAPSSGGQPSGQQAASTPSRTLVMIARGEPINLGAVRMVSAGPAGRELSKLFFATLDFADERGIPQPYLAEALPQLNTDTWRVFPDGRMETTHRLRPNLTWHDGTPLAAEDFVFAYRVYATPAIGVAASPPLNQMEGVEAPDPRTLVIRWRQSYPDANKMTEGFQALPRHILESVFQEGNIEPFANHPYWTQEYVGLGPYRLHRWEPGTFIEAAAFDGHALGRPKIDRVKVLVATDPNAALAALLSGEAHIMIDNMLGTEDVPVVKNAGFALLVSPVGFRVVQYQLRPEMGALRELADVRVRAAIAHAVDKRGLNEGLHAGQAVVTDSLVSPLFDYHAAVERVITRYPYDTRRAQQLLEEAGLRKDGDGFYQSLSGGSFQMEVRTTASPATEAENAILVEGFRRLGLNAHTYVLPVSMMRDNQAVTTFPALFPTGRTGGEDALNDYTTVSIPRAENRWLGGNRGGWTNPTYDRLWDAFNSTLDRNERIQQIAGMEKIVSEEVVATPIYYTPRMIAHVPTLRGPVSRAARDAMELVHVHAWEWVEAGR